MECEPSRVPTAGYSGRGIDRALKMGMPTKPEVIEVNRLSTVTGGADPGNQAELRSMAQRWCPATYNKFKTAPALTRAMGERCLDEAGYGAFKSRLDKYFPRAGAK
jgi:hypothetical protein